MPLSFFHLTLFAKQQQVITLFDGVEKLKKRATSIFGNDGEQKMRQLSEAPILQQFTTKQNGNDKTLAALKGLELGEAVKNRLITNFELQADARGGIDGLIFSSFNAINKNQAMLKGKMNEDFSVERILCELEAKSEKVKGRVKGSGGGSVSKEKLIGAIGKGSLYKDLVLGNLETQLVLLNKRAEAFGLGDLFSAKKVAVMNSGGGADMTSTQTLFAPVVEKASGKVVEEIDNIEQKTENATIKVLLQYVARRGATRRAVRTPVGGG